MARLREGLNKFIKENGAQILRIKAFRRVTISHPFGAWTPASHGQKRGTPTRVGVHKNSQE